MQSRELYRRLKEAIDTLEVIDTHEHHSFTEEEYLRLKADFGRFFVDYTIDDLESAGMPLPNRVEFQDTGGQVLQVNGAPLSLDEKWKYIKPYWERCRFTGYGRAVRHSLRKLFSVDDLTDRTYAEVSEKLAALMRPGVYRKLLKETCGLRHIVNDINFALDPLAHRKMDHSLYHFIGRINNFTMAFMKAEIERLEKVFDRSIHTIDDLVGVMDSLFEILKRDGCLAIKISQAYESDLHFEDATREEAERVLRKTLTLRKVFDYQEAMSFSEARPLMDFVVHRAVDRAEAYDFPVIIHTGVQAGMTNEVRNSNAAYLTDLFRKYPKVRFHLLHASYPYMQEAACLAKQFANVSLDLTWVNIIVPAGAREGLSHFLDTVPVNKIHAFGGDLHMPECIWGALEVARENVAHVLAEKVEEDVMTETEAVDVARMLFAGNIREILRL